MGECFRITQGGDTFALKVIQSEVVGDSDAWARYLREIRIWTTLSACEGVVEALCVTRVNEIPVVCSRWMPGGDLRRHLQNRTPEFFFSVMARVVGTLAWANQRHDVIHRDLKPENILLDEDGLAFVSDWGLALPLAAALPATTGRKLDSANLNLSAAGQFLGTIYYASPEQILAEVPPDHRADIYSLGCLMYEWESQGCPFVGATAEEVALKHLFESPTSLRRFFRKTTFGAEDVIHACLQKDPGKRPQDYGSLDVALAEAAKTRNVPYRTYIPGERYAMSMVGARTFPRFRWKDAVENAEGTYRVIDHSELEPFIREADVLVSVGDYSAAAEILGSLFVPEMATAHPDSPHDQCVATAYALCLTQLGRADEAIKVLECLSAAVEKPAEYFVNLSYAQIRVGDFGAARITSIEGLRQYGDDQDLVGNLLVSQTALGDFKAGAVTAMKRLVGNRNVHSLEEVATFNYEYANTIRERDWPRAVEHLRHTVRLLREAKNLNPRYLPVRRQLAVALESTTAYAQCSAEIAGVMELPLHVTHRVFLVYLQARCLDRARSYQECLKFCNRWLAKIAEVKDEHPLLHAYTTSLKRVRAMTIADGFCIGKMTDDGKRVMVRGTDEFFSEIVQDEQLREPDDFCFLARFHDWLEEHEEAEEVLATAKSFYPQHWGIPFQRAAFRCRAGDYSTAVEQAEIATQLAPWRTQAWELLGEALDGQGRSGEAGVARDRAKEVQRVRNQLAEEIASI